MFPIIEKLGGWDAVKPLLDERGILPGEEAQRQWRKRQRRLPRDVVALLGAEAASRGIAFTPEDFELSENAAA